MEGMVLWIGVFQAQYDQYAVISLGLLQPGRSANWIGAHDIQCLISPNFRMCFLTGRTIIISVKFR